MKTAIVAVVLLLASCAFAQTDPIIVSVPVPRDIAPDLREMCNSIQRANAFESFTNAQCAEHLFRLALRKYKAKKARAEVRADARTAERVAGSNAEAHVDTTWPSNLVVVECGNGRVENVPALNHVEECDDGNTTNGDGCDLNCQTE